MSNLILGYINFDPLGNISDAFNPSTFISKTVATQSVNTETINVSSTATTNGINDFGIVDAEHLIIQQSAIFLGDISANSNSLCTTAFVEERFQQLLGPETLDNLNSIKELSDSLNNDPQFFLTIQNTINDLSSNLTNVDISMNALIVDVSQNLYNINTSLLTNIEDLSSYSHTTDVFIQDQVDTLNTDMLNRITDISNDIINYKSYVDSIFVDIHNNIDISYSEVNTKILDLSNNTTTIINTSLFDLSSNLNTKIVDLSNNTNTALSNLLNTVNNNITTSINDVMTYIDQQDAIIQTNIDTVISSVENAQGDITSLQSSTSTLINDISSYKFLNNSLVSDISLSLINNVQTLTQSDTTTNNLLNDLSSNHQLTKAFAVDISNNLRSYITSNNTFNNDISLSLKNNVDALTLIDNSYNFLIYDLSNNHQLTKAYGVDLSNNLQTLNSKTLLIDSSLNALYTTVDSNISLLNDLSNNKASVTFVNDAIASLIDSSPSTLNTLNELSQALGNDANFVTTVTNSIGLRALDSDVMHLAGTETITGNKTFSGSVSGITKAMIGLGNVNNTADMDLPISTATLTALNGKQNTLTSSSISDNLLASTFVKVNDDITVYVNKTLNLNGTILANTKTISAVELSYLDNLTEPLPDTLTSLQSQITTLSASSGSVDLSNYQVLISDTNQIQQSNVAGLVTALSNKQATLTNGSVTDSLLASTFLKPGTAISTLDISCTNIIASKNVAFGSASEIFTSISNNGTVNSYTLDYTGSSSTFILTTAPTANFTIRLNNCGTDVNKAINFCVIYNTTGKYYCTSVSAYSNTASSILSASSPIFLGGTPNITSSILMIQSFSLIRNFTPTYCISSVASYY